MTKATDDKDKQITYEQFREEWLADIESEDLSPLDKGRRFGTKIITQWLDVSTEDEDFVVYDGSGDGGIDIAYLQRADRDAENNGDDSSEGDIWYLVTEQVWERPMQELKRS